MTHGHTAPSPSGVREHEGALRGRCVRSVDVHGMDRQAAGVHAVGTRSERATMGSRSRFSAPPMKSRDTFQSERASERAMGDYSAVLVLGRCAVIAKSDRLSRRVGFCEWCRVGIRIRCAQVDMRIGTLCKVGDPDGGVQWLRQYLG